MFIICENIESKQRPTDSQNYISFMAAKRETVNYR